MAGDIVAKEGEDGHMRLLLARPVSRFRVLLLKYLTCTGYAVFLIQFLAWTAFCSAWPCAAGAVAFVRSCRRSPSSRFMTGTKVAALRPWQCSASASA
jgi:hypothetical protein